MIQKTAFMKLTQNIIKIEITTKSSAITSLRWQTRTTRYLIQPCCTQMLTVTVINWWPTTITSLSHCPSKLTAPEMIDVTTHMVGTHQHLNGSHLHITQPPPFQGRFAIHGLALATVNLPTKSEVSNRTHYEQMKGDTKCRKWGGLG